MNEEQKKYIAASLVALVALSFWLGSRYEAYQSSRQGEVTLSGEPLLVDADEAVVFTPQEETPTVVTVHVAGAVQRPGVYELPQGARIEDALQAAGLGEDALPDQINRAALLHDGEKIVVPDIAATAPLAVGEAVATGIVPHDATININQADLTSLMSLPGIGEVKAKAILDYRIKHGPFQKPEDLKKVSGIGDKTYEQLSEQIRVY